jgi:hypothetical protein
MRAYRRRRRGAGLGLSSKARARWERETAVRRRMEQRAQAARDNGSVTSRLIRKDMRLLTEADVASASIGGVITDPAYLQKLLSLHANLYELSSRVLEPSGWLGVMAGILYLPRIFELMPYDADLKYRGALVWYMPGGATKWINNLGVHQSSKLILLYQKPPLSRLPETKQYLPD